MNLDRGVVVVLSESETALKSVMESDWRRWIQTCGAMCQCCHRFGFEVEIRGCLNGTQCFCQALDVTFKSCMKIMGSSCKKPH